MNFKLKKRLSSLGNIVVVGLTLAGAIVGLYFLMLGLTLLK
jgi:hypothetical protein